jgi:hypothetical protein
LYSKIVKNDFPKSIGPSKFEFLVRSPILIETKKITKVNTMATKASIIYITAFFLLVISHISVAVTLPSIPLEPIYFEPPIKHAEQADYQLNCVQIDNAIRSLHPYQYSYKPGFYDDDANKVAVVLAVTDIVPIFKGLAGFAYLGYSAMVEEQEQRRILDVSQQMAMLQQLKAEKHCFE